jgi:hypothetical protein
MSMIVVVVLSLLTLVLAPTLAGKAMGLKGGFGKGAMVGLITLGLMQIVGLAAPFIGPLGEILTLMGGVAAWYQVVKVIHGTDTAKTIVFMFWHVFFQLLSTSLLAMFFGLAKVAWMWRG